MASKTAAVSARASTAASVADNAAPHPTVAIRSAAALIAAASSCCCSSDVAVSAEEEVASDSERAYTFETITTALSIAAVMPIYASAIAASSPFPAATHDGPLTAARQRMKRHKLPMESSEALVCFKAAHLRSKSAKREAKEKEASPEPSPLVTLAVCSASITAARRASSRIDASVL